MNVGKHGESYYLQPVINTCTANDRIYAFDVRRANQTMGKAFIRASDTEFNDILSKNIWGNHFYEILLPDRPTRIFIDIETENGDYATVKRGAETCVFMLNAMLENDYDFKILDSSNEKKCSFHVIGGPYFKNPFHVGALIRKMTCYVLSALNCTGNVQNFDLLSLYDKDNNYIIDECIYTLNRQFRLAEMSKLGSNRVLKGCLWHESLLQNVNVCEPMECLEIDGGEPISTSRKTKEMFTLINGTWKRVGNNTYSNSNVSADLPPYLISVLNYIETYIHGNVTGVRFNVNNGCYGLSSTCKKCFISNKTHRSNHTWFVLNPWKRTVVQKCFDDLCKRKEFDISVPESCWSDWIGISQQQIDISSIENSV